MSFLKQSFKGLNHWSRYAIILGVFLTPFLSGFIKNSIIKPLLPFFNDDASTQFAIKQFKYVLLTALFLILFKIIHKRDYKTLLTARKEFDFLRFWFSFSIWGVLLMLALTTKVILNPDVYEWNFKLVPFFKLFLLLILLLPFRAFFTAIFTNSYILQTLTKVTKRPWVSLIIAVTLFTALMFVNNKNAIINSNYQLVFYYLMLGLMLYLIVILDEGIEIISGVFLVSMFISRLFITYSTNKTLLDTIFIKQGSRDIILFAYIIPFICCPLFFLILCRVYKWSNWKEKLFEKLDNTKDL